MDKTVPSGAAYLLNWIASIEVGTVRPEGYTVIFSHGHKRNRALIARPITQRTVDEWIAGMPWGMKSSASGRYQFMKATLKDLKAQLGLRGGQVMNSDLQDRLGYHLLRRRGYDKWIAGTLSDSAFALNLAKEWASLPVLSSMKGAHRQLVRGQSYYAGDALNKSLIKPEKVEQALREARAASRVPRKEPDVAPTPTTPVPTAGDPSTEPSAIPWYQSPVFTGALTAFAGSLWATWQLYKPGVPLTQQLDTLLPPVIAAGGSLLAVIKRLNATAQPITGTQAGADRAIARKEIADEAIVTSRRPVPSLDEAWTSPLEMPVVETENAHDDVSTAATVRHPPLEEVSIKQWSEEMPDVVAKFAGIMNEITKLAEVGKNLTVTPTTTPPPKV